VNGVFAFHSRFGNGNDARARFARQRIRGDLRTHFELEATLANVGGSRHGLVEQGAVARVISLARAKNSPFSHLATDRRWAMQRIRLVGSAFDKGRHLAARGLFRLAHWFLRRGIYWYERSTISPFVIRIAFFLVRFLERSAVILLHGRRRYHDRKNLDWSNRHDNDY
jgi:hypothetical protein